MTKNLLGLWVGEAEGANFWLSVLTELKNRGVENIFIVSIDGLKGFPEAINSVFPKTEIQLCVIHQIRNTLKYVASKDKKIFMNQLKEVYKAPTEQAALMNLDTLECLFTESKFVITFNSIFPFIQIIFQSRFFNLLNTHSNLLWKCLLFSFYRKRLCMLEPNVNWLLTEC